MSTNELKILEKINNLLKKVVKVSLDEIRNEL